MSDTINLTVRITVLIAGREIVVKESDIPVDINAAEPNSTERILSVNSESVIPLVPIDLPHMLAKPNGYLTIEEFGGNGYYKRIDDGLHYQGKVITCSVPVFSSDDLGMSFCGLFAHKNPQNPDGDLFYPNSIGSRYSKILEVISPHEIRVDFEYNLGSNKGYIFFDNSDAYEKLMKTYVQDDSVGVWFDSKTYVIPQFSDYILPSHKNFIMKSSGKSYLKFDIEDYFSWGAGLSGYRYRRNGFLFQIGVSDKDFISENIVYLPPHRRIRESELTGLNFFGGKEGNIGEQKRTLYIVGNTAMDEIRAIGDKVTEEVFIGIGLGLLYAGGTYTGDGTKITDDVEDYLTISIKDFEHEGPGFSDLKANLGGGLRLVAEDVHTSYLDEEQYNPTSVKMRGKFSSDYSGLPIKDSSFYPGPVLEIVSDNSWYQTVVDNATRGWNNSAHAVMIERFVFWQPCGNYWKYLYETWFNTGEKNDIVVEPHRYNFFTGQKMMFHLIPQVGRNYWVSRKYDQNGRVIGDTRPDKIKGSVNWAAVQNTEWDKVNGIPHNAMPIQLQPGDKFELKGRDEEYTVISTEREVHPLFVNEVAVFGGHDSVVSYFSVYTLDKNLPDDLGIAFEIIIKQSSAEHLLDGREFEFYSIYKSNKFLNRHNLETKFGDRNILESNPFGHVSYNHQQITVWAKNWKHNGFYRQSDNNYDSFSKFQITEGKTEALRRWSKGHVYINCSGFIGQFDPSFNFWIREKVYGSLNMVMPKSEKVILFNCSDMNGLEERNDSYVINVDSEPDKVL